jgi:Phosphate-selective porin O and P
MRLGRRLFALCVAVFALTGRADQAVAEEDHPAARAPAAAGARAPSIPEDAGPGPSDPLAGFAGERAFLRSPGNELVLLPGFRLQVGGAFFPRPEPTSGFFLRRARVELAGWLGPAFYFTVGGDFAPVTAGSAADVYVAFAPLRDLFIVQAGQFDVPFSLENRTLDGYTTFIERSLAVRALGAPLNKDVGIMVHGADQARTFHYAAGVFNGDGPGFRNADSQVDLIGRVVAAPMARTSFEGLHAASVGASVWYGQHLAGLPVAAQTTAGGFRFFEPRWTSGQPPNTMTLELHQHGPMLVLGGEVNLPVGHLFGVRGEAIFKKQDLAEDNVGTNMMSGQAKLQGIGAYGEAWLWLLGDDRQLPRVGVGQQLPVRLTRVAETPRQDSVMLAVRGEILKEDLTSTQPILGNPNLATTRLITGSVGVNYWYGGRVRASVNYGLTVFSGTTENINTLKASGQYEHELLLLLAMAL